MQYEQIMAIGWFNDHILLLYFTGGNFQQLFLLNGCPVRILVGQLQSVHTIPDQKKYAGKFKSKSE